MPARVVTSDGIHALNSGTVFMFVEMTSNGRSSACMSRVVLKYDASRFDHPLSAILLHLPKETNIVTTLAIRLAEHLFPVLYHQSQAVADLEKHASLNTRNSPLHWLAPLRHQETSRTAYVGSHFSPWFSSTL